MSNNLRKIRIERGLSQEELGERVDTTSQQIGHLERGSRQLTEAWLRHLSVALGCTMAEILGEETDLNSEEMRILEKYRGMSEQDRQRFHHMADIFGDTKDQKAS